MNRFSDLVEIYESELRMELNKLTNKTDRILNELVNHIQEKVVREHSPADVAQFLVSKLK